MIQLVNTMKINEQAYMQIKSAQSTYTMAMILSYAGGFMVGWPLGTAIGVCGKTHNFRILLIVWSCRS